MYAINVFIYVCVFVCAVTLTADCVLLDKVYSIVFYLEEKLSSFWCIDSFRIWCCINMAHRKVKWDYVDINKNYWIDLVINWNTLPLEFSSTSRLVQLLESLCKHYIKKIWYHLKKKSLKKASSVCTVFWGKVP